MIKKLKSISGNVVAALLLVIALAFIIMFYAANYERLPK